jgi:hypothetical protein
VNGSTDLELQNPLRPKTTPIIIGLRKFAPAQSSFPQGNDLVRWQGKSKNRAKPARYLA